LKGGKMRKIVALMIISLAFFALLAPVAVVEAAEATEEVVSEGLLNYRSTAAIAAAIAVTIAAFGCGIGQGLATGKAVEGIARNPGAAGKVTTPLIIGLAMMESLTIYGFVIAVLLLFVKW
jgi:F-type H+-transporting ATPase subunit c